jgi:primosomal protein DnaI
MEEIQHHHRPRKRKDLIPLHNLLGPDSEITKEQYERNKIWIEQIREAQKLCEACKGTDCPQFNKGYMPIFDCFCGNYSMSLLRCPHNELVKHKGEARKLQQEAHIPQRYAKLTFPDLKNMELSPKNRVVAITLLQLSKEPKRNEGLYLHGTPGVGKTMLVSILGNTLLKAGKKVLFSNTTELLNQLRQRIKSDWNEELARYQKVPCLILDDVGVTKMTEWGLEQMFRLLDARYEEERQTFFTSNYSLEQLQKKLLDMNQFEETQVVRLISRMAGLARQVELTGEDKRWKPASTLFEKKSLERKTQNAKKTKEQSLFA